VNQSQLSEINAKTKNAMSQPKIDAANFQAITTPNPYDKKTLQVGTAQMTPNTKKLYAFGESSS
jgi:hypothetical protein